MKTCGSCTLCCHTVPVAEIGLKSFTRCQHERTAPFAEPGCAIYGDRPKSCRLWSCQYLLEDWDDELRPDRCGVVVDSLPDLIRCNGEEVAAVQMWVSAGHERDFEKQPIAAVVLGAISLGYAVIWRYRGENGQQIAVGLYRDPAGNLIASAPTPPDDGFAKGMSTVERFARAAAIQPGARR